MVIRSRDDLRQQQKNNREEYARPIAFCHVTIRAMLVLARKFERNSAVKSGVDI
jgi:hypothetical protein